MPFGTEMELQSVLQYVHFVPRLNLTRSTELDVSTKRPLRNVPEGWAYRA